MKRELRYATFLLLIVFIHTIGIGSYIHIMYGKSNTCTVSQKQHDSHKQSPYNLYAHALKEAGIDKCTDDQKQKWYVRNIVDYSIMQILTKSYVATNATLASVDKPKSNDYYVFALRKIVV